VSAEHPFRAAQEALRRAGGPPVVWESARLPAERLAADDPPLCEAERCEGLEHPAAYVVRMHVAGVPAFQFYACAECHVYMLVNTTSEGRTDGPV
jgi:hypothetical protein